MFIRIQFETRAQRKARKAQKPLFSRSYDETLKNATIVK